MDQYISRYFKVKRYSFLRYTNSILFFIYLYTTLNIGLINFNINFFVLLILSISILYLLVNQYKTTKGEKIDFNKSQKIYIINLVLNILLFFITMYDFKFIYPKYKSKFIGLTIIFISIALLIYNIYRINKISKNKDKMYLKYQQYIEDNKNRKGKIHYV